MAITYPLVLPSVGGIAKVRFTARSMVGLSASPWTAKQEIQVHQGQWWEADLVLGRAVRSVGEAWNAFRLKLNGKEGTFLLGDPWASVPRGAAKDTPGTPLVNGASQTGNALVIDGAPSDVTGWLLEGDYIQLGTGATSQLHKVIEDADTDGGGNATLTIWPDLRSSPADGAAIVVSAAKGVFRLASNEMPWDENLPDIYDIVIAAVEAL